MLKSPFKFLGFNGHAKTPKPNPQNERKKKGLGKLRKVRHPANTSRVVTDSEGKQSGEHNQNQVHRPSVHNTDTIHPFSPHTQSYDSENNDLSSSISVNPSRNSSGGRAQAPISGDPNRLQTSTPSVRRDSLGGGNSFQTHEWDGDHGGVQDWINIGLDYIPKGIVSAIMAPERSTPSNVDPHQHEPEAQEHHDENDNLKKASPIVSQADPLEEENRGRKENVSKHDRESRNAAGHGDRVKDSFEPEIYYYIVPAGLDVIFQDEDGTEITRVGKTIKGTQDHASHTHTKNIPIVVQDIFGNELFRSNLDQGSLNDPNLGLPSPNHTSWKTVIVDEKGKQIPLKYAERNVGPG